MKKLLCSFVALSILTSALPVAAAAGETTTKVPIQAPGSLQAAVQRAAAGIQLQPAADPQAATLPAPAPRRGSSQVRHQGGGGKTGMVIGLVSTLVGVATTVVIVKQMQKTTEQATKQQQQ